MTELQEKRLAICEKCPLYKMGMFGPVCNPDKYMNHEGEIAFLPKAGFKKGCGCLLVPKSKHVDNHCTVGKW